MPTQPLSDWYHSLFSRRVDLVSDYAGAELFHIEGDSLLLHAFSDDKLDFSHGLQVLHAVYLVESYLQKLLQRNCVFEIVFFKSTARNCVPGAVPNSHESRYLLAREIIIQHLSHIQTNSRIQIRVFESYKCREFVGYLKESSGYFFMCHDGSGDDSAAAAAEASMDGTAHRSKIGLRLMILWLISYGYSIALLNNTEFRDTKIMAMVVHGSSARAREHLVEAETKYSLTIRTHGDERAVPEEVLGRSGSTPNSHSDKPEPSFAPAIPLGVQELLKDAVSFHGELTQRQYLTVVSIGHMYNAGLISMDNMAEVQAMLLQTTMLAKLDLSARQIELSEKKESKFLDSFTRVAVSILQSEPWQDTMRRANAMYDLWDFLDGRLFLAILDSGLIHSPKFQSLPFYQDFHNLASLTAKLCGIELRMEIFPTALGKFNINLTELHASSIVETVQSVLPFHNKVFDRHLRPVHLTLSAPTANASTSVIFRELTHWHNHKRALDSKVRLVLTPWEKSRMLRRNQRYMTEMRDYAASLTNSVGGLLQPEKIVAIGANEKERGRGQPAPKLTAKAGKNSTAQKPGGKTQGKGGKHARVSVKDAAMLEIRRKDAEAARRQVDRWAFIRKTEFDGEKDLEALLAKVKQHLASLPKEARAAVEADIQTYILNILVRMLVNATGEHGSRQKQLSISALAWEAICRISKLRQGVTKETVRFVREVIGRLGFADIQLQADDSDRKLTFEAVDLATKQADLRVGMSAKEFQLTFTGPFMDRNMDSAFDARTPEFEPDKWQRDVLDQIDARNSLFVVAPTSAGKTFISFYAMKQVLQEGDDGVLVYVAPTKALVNQIAAEIQARFSKSYPSRTTGKSVWAMHTRDHRINNPTGCQILVTVPHVLQIMLLAPGNANTWSPRVKRIIFDEIHCIGQSDDGIIWEQLLLLSPCPVIALSATVGNPEEFYDWLKLAQEANGIELKMIQHNHRYSDLRKFRYQPPKEFSFEGLPRPDRLPLVGLDGVEGLRFIHPVGCLVDPSRSIPPDLSLEPRDCLTLWRALQLHQTPRYPVDKSLAPDSALPSVIRKADVVEWQSRLIAVLESWRQDSDSPFEKVVGELGPSVAAAAAAAEDRDDEASDVNENGLLQTTLPLVCSLHSQNALPAIFFNYDRSKCEEIARQLLSQLQEAETNWKASSSSWKTKLDKWEQWKRVQEKQGKAKAPRKSKKGKDDDDEGWREERLCEKLAKEPSQWEFFDPDKPIDQFSLADGRKIQASEFEEYASSVRDREVAGWLIDALERGIGVHHAGMNRRYRQICEVLFRKGYLRVVIATGTLALGINMPCKTVVFAGDSIFLTALNFRQAAGRAGRRGFDLLGNVIFQNIAPAKAARLISSKLPDLKGHFPITTSLVLRMCILLHQSTGSAYAVKSINSLLSCPRICLGGAEMKDSVLHHLRFSIEYLQRNNLLDGTGAPLNFAGCISHLYYTETSSFAFHALLQSGYLHRLALGVTARPRETLLTLMLVMAHLFGRRPLTKSTLERQSRRSDRPSSSLVTLPQLPHEARSVLHQHNQETLGIYIAYVSSFIEQHVKEPDCMLPLSKIRCGAADPTSVSSSIIKNHAPTRITSNFIALSGHKDRQVRSISDLCRMVRSGVWLEEAVIPHIPVYPDDDGGGGGSGVAVAPLNAYLYDFFKHGNTRELEAANGIRRGELWFLLNDFSTILATIITSLENLVSAAASASGGESGDMLDVVSAADARDGERENRLVEAELRKEGVAGDSDGEVTVNHHGDVVTSSSKHPQHSEGSLLQVLEAFKMLRQEFDLKFRSMWA